MKVIPVPCLSNNYAYMWVWQLLLLPQHSAAQVLLSDCPLLQTVQQREQ